MDEFTVTVAVTDNGHNTFKHYKFVGNDLTKADAFTLAVEAAREDGYDRPRAIRVETTTI